MESFHSYPKIYALGHSAIADLLKGPCIVEEKIDGSQFSFGNAPGILDVHVRSKGCVLNPLYPEGMFKKVTDWVMANADKLHPGWTYRAEVLNKPKHNVLHYARVPENNMIVFDITTGLETYLSYEEKLAECKRIGLECVPMIAWADDGETAWDYEQFRKWLQTTSCLGGQLVEGIVIKNYERYGRDGKTLMGKYVSEQFKESHKREWTGDNKGSILDRLIKQYRTEARWMKAVQHLKERGELLGDVRDIGNLIKEVQKDFEEEEFQEVAVLLFKEFRKDLIRGVSRGLPEWWKDRLARQQWEPM